MNLINIPYTRSPNQDFRPHDSQIELLVIHAISLPPRVFGGQYIHDLFLNCLDSHKHPYFQTIKGLKVSSHLLIDRFGLITQFVPFNRRAWHAGISNWQGREKCNDFSIGIELEGSDYEEYTDLQYDALVNITKELFVLYPLLSEKTICGHSDIAPGRKTDPGPFFDWQRYFSSL